MKKKGMMRVSQQSTKTKEGAKGGRYKINRGAAWAITERGQ
jgi:hypothetical protein